MVNPIKITIIHINILIFLAINDLLYVAGGDDIRVYNFTNGEQVNILQYPVRNIRYPELYASQDDYGNVWLMLSYFDKGETAMYWAGYK